MRGFAFRTFLSNYVITHGAPLFASLLHSLCNLSFLPTTTSVLSLTRRDRRRSPAIATSLGRESNFTLMIIKCLPFAAVYATFKTRSAWLLHYHSFEKKRVNYETFTNAHNSLINLIHEIAFKVDIRIYRTLCACFKGSHFLQLHFIRKSEN